MAWRARIRCRRYLVELLIREEDVVKNLRTGSLVLGAAVLGSLMAVQVAVANEGAAGLTFEMTELSQGYLLADGEDAAPAEGNCGEDNSAEDKGGEGKCGEGKCGEGKCGEGKCGSA